MAEGDLSAKTKEMFIAISKNIKTRRISRKYTQEKLAEVLGVSTQYLSQLERGESKPSLKLLVAISHHLDCPLYSLIPDTQAGPGQLTRQISAKMSAANPVQQKIALEIIDWCLERNVE